MGKEGMELHIYATLMPSWRGQRLSFFFALLLIIIIIIIIFSKFKFLAHKTIDKICYIQNKKCHVIFISIDVFWGVLYSTGIYATVYVWE
jgi:hypothetical protein